MPVGLLHSHYWTTKDALDLFMKKLSAFELSSIREAQTDFLNDECDIITNVISQNTFGDEVRSPTTHAEIDCGVTFLGAGSDGRKSDDGRTEIEYDILIRLPLLLGFDVDMHTQYVINDKAGITVGRTFRPVAPPEIGFSAQIIKLKEVDN